MKAPLPFVAFLATTLVTALTPTLAAQDMPKPGPEHQALAGAAGTWDLVVERAGPDGKPTQSKGVSEIKVALGGFWLVEDFSADLSGMPFQGHGLTTYDPGKGKYIGTWVDCFGPYLMQLEGTMSKDGKTLTMSGMGPNHEGKLVMHRMVSTTKDANTRVFEMYVPGPDGKEVKGMTITYTRRAAKNAGPSDRVK